MNNIKDFQEDDIVIIKYEANLVFEKTHTILVTGIVREPNNGWPWADEMIAVEIVNPRLDLWSDEELDSPFKYGGELVWRNPEDILIHYRPQ